LLPALVPDSDAIALTGRSGPGFALCFPLLFASLTGRSGPGLSLWAECLHDVRAGAAAGRQTSEKIVLR